MGGRGGCGGGDRHGRERVVGRAVSIVILALLGIGRGRRCRGCRGGDGCCGGGGCCGGEGAGFSALLLAEDANFAKEVEDDLLDDAGFLRGRVEAQCNLCHPRYFLAFRFDLYLRKFDQQSYGE